MSKFLDFFKEVTEAYSDALKYAEYECFKLKEDIVSLLKQANSKGYSNPDYCKMDIEVVNTWQTIVNIELIYRKTSSTVQRFTRTLDLGKIKYMPELMKSQLALSSKFSVELDVEDLSSLYSISASDVTPEISFDSLEIFNFKNISQQPIKKELFIKDDLFYYIVEATGYFENEISGTVTKETKRRYIGSIKNLPASVQNQIIQDPDHSVLLDVTSKSKN